MRQLVEAMDGVAALAMEPGAAEPCWLGTILGHRLDRPVITSGQKPVFACAAPRIDENAVLDLATP